MGVVVKREGCGREREKKRGAKRSAVQVTERAGAKPTSRGKPAGSGGNDKKRARSLRQVDATSRWLQMSGAQAARSRRAEEEHAHLEAQDSSRPAIVERAGFACVVPGRSATRARALAPTAAFGLRGGVESSTSPACLQIREPRAHPWTAGRAPVEPKSEANRPSQTERPRRCRSSAWLEARRCVSTA